MAKSESNLKAHFMSRVSIRLYRVAALTETKQPGVSPSKYTSEIETLKKLTGIYMSDSTFFYKVPDWYVLLFRPVSQEGVSVDELSKITQWV